MLKSKYLYVCLATGLLFAIPLAASAKLGANKLGLNGVSLNGASLNGVSLNGISLNGANLNGSTLQGTELNTSKITSIASQGVVRVEGGQLVMQLSPAAQ
jgi:uncharacterized protein YjbI with pentapeptide repeats